MANSEQLRKVVADKGLKYLYLANELKLSPYGLQMKIENKNEFKASEIEKLTRLLNLSSAERDEIFFNENVTNSQHLSEEQTPSAIVAKAIGITVSDIIGDGLTAPPAK